MNIIVALAAALGLLLVDLCGIGTTAHALHVERWTAGRLSISDFMDSVSAAATTTGDDVIYAAKGVKGNKKQKAVNPWPMSGKVNDPLVELIMLGIGLVVLFVLWVVAYQNGAL